MHLISRVRSIPAHTVLLNTLHILNDGYLASFMLLLPFIATAQQLNLVQIGALGTALNVATLVIAVPSSTIAKRLGNLRALTIAMVAYGVAILGIGTYGNFAWLIAMFVLGGLCFGIFHPIAFSLISKWSSSENRGRMMGNFTAIGDIGRIGIAAAVSFLVVYLGWRFTTFLYAGIALVLGVCLLLYLRKNHERMAANEQKAAAELPLKKIIKNRRYVFALSADTLDTFVSDSLYVFLPFLLLARGIGPALLGTFAAAFFIGNILGKTALGRFADKVGAARVFVASEVLMAIFIVLLANSDLVFMIIICSVILGFLTKGTVPVLKTMLADSVEHHGNYEKAFALEAVVTGVAKTLAPITLGIVANSFGVVSSFMVMAAAVLLAAIPGTLYFLAKPGRPVASASVESK